MADLPFSTSLNDKDYQSTLVRMEKNTARTANILSMGFAKAVGAKALEVATDAMHKYADSSERGAKIMKDFDSAFDKLKLGIGRDLVHGLGATTASVKSFADGLEAARGVAVNFVAGLMGGDGETIDAALKKDEKLDKVRAKLKMVQDLRLQVREMELETRADIGQDRGNGGFNDTYQDAQVSAYLKQVKAITQLKELTKELNDEQREQLGVNRLTELYRQRADVQRQAAARQAVVDERRHTMQIKTMIEERETERLSLYGYDAEVENRQRKLKLAQDQLAIDENKNLTEYQKRLLKGVVKDQSDENYRISQLKVNSTRDLGPAISTAGIQGQVFFAEKTQNHYMRSEAWLNKINDTLIQILGKGGEGLILR